MERTATVCNDCGVRRCHKYIPFGCEKYVPPRGLQEKFLVVAAEHGIKGIAQALKDAKLEFRETNNKGGFKLVTREKQE